MRVQKDQDKDASERVSQGKWEDASRKSSTERGTRWRRTGKSSSANRSDSLTQPMKVSVTLDGRFLHTDRRLPAVEWGNGGREV